MTREAEIRQTADEWLGYYHPTCTQDMLVEAFRCGAEWADAHQPSPWISVEDRLPEKTKGIFSCQVRELEEDKIVYYKDTRGYIHTGFFSAHNHWRDLDRDNGAIYPVTHWMPIPGLPKGGEKTHDS